MFHPRYSEWLALIMRSMRARFVSARPQENGIGAVRCAVYEAPWLVAALRIRRSRRMSGGAVLAALCLGSGD
jgi:hypothetical protein